MRKKGSDQFSWKSIYQRDKNWLCIFVLAVCLCACQAQPNSVGFPTVEVRIEAPVTPSPTPACTPLQPGMDISVHPLLNQEILIQLKSFKAGDSVEIITHARYGDSAIGADIPGIPILTDGSATQITGSYIGSSSTNSHWHVEVVYTGGVACGDFDIRD